MMTRLEALDLALQLINEQALAATDDEDYEFFTDAEITIREIYAEEMKKMHDEMQKND